MRRQRTPLDPNVAAQRRLGSYPQDYWDILASIQRRATWSKRFEHWHIASAFTKRFYKFRMDAIQCRVPGALDLRQLIATGIDAEGKLFRANRQGTAPYLIQWIPLGEEPVIAAAQPTAATPIPPAYPDEQQAGPVSDPFEKMMEEYLKKDKPKSDT